MDYVDVFLDPIVALASFWLGNRVARNQIREGKKSELIKELKYFQEFLRAHREELSFILLEYRKHLNMLSRPMPSIPSMTTENPAYNIYLSIKKETLFEAVEFQFPDNRNQFARLIVLVEKINERLTALNHNQNFSNHELKMVQSHEAPCVQQIGILKNQIIQDNGTDTSKWPLVLRRVNGEFNKIDGARDILISKNGLVQIANLLDEALRREEITGIHYRELVRESVKYGEIARNYEIVWNSYKSGQNNILKEIEKFQRELISIGSLFRLE